MPTRPLASVKQIKMMAYNAENFFLHMGENAKESLEDFKKRIDTELKSDEDMKGIARAIQDETPDFIVMEEVENRETLQAFSERYLNGTYEAYLIKGNDERGIQIGYLVKKDLPLQISLETHKDVTWKDPNDGREAKLFSRDAPALLIRRQGDAPDAAPALIFIGNHAKSQRNRNGDPRSSLLRTAQMKEIASIVEDYQGAYGANVPIVLGGDFNVDVRLSPEVEPIRERMVDPFDAKGIRGLPRMTHTFHPRRGHPSYHQLDALFVTPGLEDNIVSIETYRYKDAEGKELPLPNTYAERARNPSDHYPLVLTLSTEDVFPEAFKRAN